MSCGLPTLHNHFLVLWICNFTTASNLQLQIRMECILDWCPECTLDFAASHFQPYLAGLYHSIAPIKTITFKSKNCTETPAVKTNPSHTYNTDSRECICVKATRGLHLAWHWRTLTSAGNLKQLPDLFSELCVSSLFNSSLEETTEGAEDSTWGQREVS